MKPLDKRLLAYARGARSYIGLLAVTGLVSACLVIAQCLLISGSISPVIDGSKTFADVAGLVGILALVFALRLLVTYLQEAYGHRAALRVIADLRTQVIRRAGDQGSRWLSQGRTASTVTLATEALDDLEPYFVKFLPQMILTATVTPLTLGVILWLDWISAIAILICLPLIPIFMILVGRMTQSNSQARLSSMERLSQQLLDLLAGLATLKALGREQSPRRRVKDLGEDYADKTMRTLYVAFLSGAVLEFLATLSTALVAVEVGLRLVYGNIGLFAGLAIIMLTPEVFKPLREVGSQFHASADGVAACQSAFEILDEPPLLAGDSSTSPKLAPDLRRSAIDITELSVEAPGRATIAPDSLSARIEPGTITALKGPSGSGKSTTASVILKLVQPSGGSVTIGGIDLAEINKESLWEQVTWVPQQPVIVPGTILENLELSQEHSEDSPALLNASKLTGFDDVVASLPDGWNTLIGQGGVGLSVGQRQRLALTRALVTPRPFVILDEPSAHLDAMSETFVSAAVRALAAEGTTVLVIAHRNAILELADNVVEVQANTVRSQ
ncbi:thiol reductant ABC exporter subunit CydD [Ancrocorticia populi]|uniref:thiol reductant ABC exporter subunit CydD n=1 Tax=Ancrocorticia populi TaxID=2175228 RepID=UPI003F95BF35